MKTLLLTVCLFGAIHTGLLGQVTFDRFLLLEPKLDTSANVSMGDLDGDGHLDILLVKGRHRPIKDRVLLGDGHGGIKKEYELGAIPDRSFAGALADFNGDGYLDIAVSNDDPDRKIIYFNDGHGHFTVASDFGDPDWSTRNIAIADINRDGRPDIIMANRGDVGHSVNYVCLNDGKGHFNANCIPFAPYPATTIAPADFNGDGYVDLAVPNRDSGQSYVYMGSAEMAYPDNHRISFGKADVTIRIAAVADMNGDHILDIVTADENQGVYLYLGQQSQTFSEGILLADAKISPYALSLSDLDNDGKPDIIVGHVKAPSTVYFNDGTGKHFNPVSFGDGQGVVYGFAIGDFNEDGIPDIAAARHNATNILYFGRKVKKKKHTKR